MLPDKTARERILKTAEELFYSKGIRAVGIDTIIEKSGVAKMSLYRSFASKDDLVAAYLMLRAERYWAWWDGVMTRHPGQPRQQLLDLFEATAERIRKPEYRGCAFLNAATEFPEKGSRARKVALAHKAKRRKELLELCRQFGADQPIILATQLAILLDGAYCTAGVLGRHDATQATVRAAEALIDSAIHRGRSNRKGVNRA